MADDARYVIIKLIETPDGYRTLAAMGQLEAISIFANGRAMVHLNAIVTCDQETIIVKEPWRKCEPFVYILKTIRWIEYTTRGTEDEYKANRKKIEAQRTPE